MSRVIRSLLQVGVVLLMIAGPRVAAGEGARFLTTATWDGRADWLTIDESRIVFGSGTQVFVAGDRMPLRVESEFQIDEPVRQAVSIGNRLYLNDGNAIRVLDLLSPWSVSVPLDLESTLRGDLLLTRLGDNLIVSEDGVGLHFIVLPLPSGMHMPGHEHHFPKQPTEAALLELDGDFTAIGGAGSRVYVSDKDGIAVVDGSDVYNPELMRHLALKREVRSIAANGSRLYLLGSEGLAIVDLTDEQSVSLRDYPELSGESIQLGGRTVHVASGKDGIVTYRDAIPTAITHFVMVAGLSFSPKDIDIDLGDTVQWDSEGGLPHNVESCDGVADPPQCPSVAVEGKFVTPFPMAPTGAPFSVSHTFSVSGLNPYFCVVHVEFDMTGTVDVASGPPPAVPDGAVPTSPLRVDKILPDGSRLSLQWDTSTCNAVDHQVIFGLGAQLPIVPGGAFALSDPSKCNIGGSPFVWTGVPDPSLDPLRLLWFLLLAENNSSTEGSWGTDSAVAERVGPEAGGASGKCGITAKDLSNLCGQ